MSDILESLRCTIPCIVPLASVIGAVLTIGFIRTRTIYRGPMPSDGPVEGFASKAARIEYFSTHDQRFRETIKAIIVWIMIAIVGSGLVWFFDKFTVSIQ
jgi:hypothetical protein